MSFDWLELRIAEERERRQRETDILQRLPQGLEELHQSLSVCVAAYTAAFGQESADIHFQHGRIRITVREPQSGKWEQIAKIEITGVPAPPAFRIEQGGEPISIEVGLLPGDKLFYREGDEYLTVEGLTRRILDRAFFPKLAE